jgi:hypothetical protein
MHIGTDPNRLGEQPLNAGRGRTTWGYKPGFGKDFASRSTNFTIGGHRWNYAPKRSSLSSSPSARRLGPDSDRVLTATSSKNRAPRIRSPRSLAPVCPAEWTQDGSPTGVARGPTDTLFLRSESIRRRMEQPVGVGRTLNSYSGLRTNGARTVIRRDGRHASNLEGCSSD